MGGSGREELKRWRPPFPAVMWTVNVGKRKNPNISKSWVIVKFTIFVYPYFVWFITRFKIVFLKKSVSHCNTFFCLSKETSHVYFLKTLMTIIKNEFLYHILLINCISGRSAPQVLSVKDVYTFCFSSFLIIDLCNSAANCRLAMSRGRWFEIILLLIAPLEDFLSKHL